MTIDLTPQELADQLIAQPGLHIVDVRAPEEYRAGHIPGAINVPLDTILGVIPGVPREEPLVVVCKGGMRSALACARLAEAYATLYNLTGGTDGWLEGGYPGAKCLESVDG